MKGQAMKRTGSGGTNAVLRSSIPQMTNLAGSRVPSRLSAHPRDSPVGRADEGFSTPATPVKGRG